MHAASEASQPHEHVAGQRFPTATYSFLQDGSHTKPGDARRARSSSQRAPAAAVAAAARTHTSTRPPHMQENKHVQRAQKCPATTPSNQASRLAGRQTSAQVSPLEPRGAAIQRILLSHLWEGERHEGERSGWRRAPGVCRQRKGDERSVLPLRLPAFAPIPSSSLPTQPAWPPAPTFFCLALNHRMPLCSTKVNMPSSWRTSTPLISLQYSAPQADNVLLPRQLQCCYGSG